MQLPLGSKARETSTLSLSHVAPKMSIPESDPSASSSRRRISPLMQLELPSQDVLSAHGLSSFEPETPTGQLFLDFLSGWAILDPVVGYQTYSTVEPGETVRVRWTTRGDRRRSAAFRRLAQTIAYDCSLVPGNSEKQSHNAVFLSGSTTVRPPGRAGRDSAILAWWEDEHGFWLVTRDDSRGFVSLMDFWEESTTSEFSDSRTTSELHPKACLLLAQVANCFKV